MSEVGVLGGAEGSGQLVRSREMESQGFGVEEGGMGYDDRRVCTKM